MPALDHNGMCIGCTGGSDSYCTCEPIDDAVVDNVVSLKAIPGGATKTDDKVVESTTVAMGKTLSQATDIVSLAINAEITLFHDDGHVAYGTVPVDDHAETWKLGSRASRRWLAGLFYEATEQAPGSSPSSIICV